MRRFVIGTAGHIDHGKTTLVKALTGIDCDRWAEEKARGITIDLGFAHLSRGDLQIGFVDVPGHERFLHNALAGLGGIRAMLLVVAADEGVKPQTREHLAVCSLLGIPHGLVALTKIDLVAEDLRELAQLEVEELLATTPFAGAPILPVSSTTGEGIAELEAAILALAGRTEYEPSAPEIPVSDAGEAAGSAGMARPLPRLPTRLPIDRAFHLKGLGVIVTGTLTSGAIRTGDTLEVLPGGERVRVRSIQVHGDPREVSEAGERTSLQIAGLQLESLARGLTLVEPGTFAASARLLVRFELLPDAPASLSGFVPIQLHLFASEVYGRLRPLDPAELKPGERGLAEIRLAAPVVARRGDRFIVRRPSPAATLGGGEILDPAWRPYRGKLLPPALAALGPAPDLASALGFWVLEAGERGAEIDDLARRLGVRSSAIEADLRRSTHQGKLLAVPAGPGRGRRFLAPATYQRLAERAGKVLAEHFKRDRLAMAIPKADAVRKIVRGRGAELADVYLDWLAKQKILQVSGDQVTLPGRGSQLTSEESDLSTQVLARFDAGGLAPPSPGDVGQALSAKPQIVDGVIRHLVAKGDLIKLPSGLILAASAVAKLKRKLLATGWPRFNVGQFKDHFGLSRKWAIPLLEHLDSTAFTRRLGDERMIVRQEGA
ncbi:MAG TPA: SelB C-terminal domain-containing protein [Thermoanaerobaculia bacterium]|jgi:selenocysteine-specific elongation factor|nr:SelB C-terminal domain-containing protein [Thermoanaerobaculia bacterium]